MLCKFYKLVINERKNYSVHIFLFFEFGIKDTETQFFFRCIPKSMSEVSSDATIVTNPVTTNSSKNSGTTSESHSIQITTICLNGDNFLTWSQSVRTYIRGRGNIGYLTGEKEAPGTNDPAYSTWDAENFMVMTWLVSGKLHERRDKLKLHVLSDGTRALGKRKSDVL